MFVCIHRCLCAVLCRVWYTITAKEGLKQGDVVDLIGLYKDEKRYAHRFMPIPYDIPEGNTAAYFPETNVLVPLDSTADESTTYFKGDKDYHREARRVEKIAQKKGRLSPPLRVFSSYFILQ